jgi:phosphonoacetaldehyde hydrolase
MGADASGGLRLRALIADLAGTLVDYGSCAPAGVFVEVFRRRGVEISLREARGPMGSEKRDHIAALLAVPTIAGRWQTAHGCPPAEEDIDAMYRDFVPIQLECLPRYSDLVPGALDAIAQFRRRGLKIGVTTGYNREMLDVVLREAARQGFAPDAAVSADEVPAGRPAPWMALEAIKRMQVFPVGACVKIGDTLPDIAEGRNAGMWTVAVARTGNEIGMSLEEATAHSDAEMEPLLKAAYGRLRAAGAHWVVDSIADVPGLLDEIDERAANGERP